MISLREHKPDLGQLDVENCDLSHAPRNGMNGLTPSRIVLKVRNGTSGDVGSSRCKGESTGR